MAQGKISQRDAIRETTMFLIDNSIEERFEKQIKSEIEKYKDSMLDISKAEGLKTFIKSDKNSIKRLITVLGISGERFKRVVSLIRVHKGYTFDTEWNETKLQSELVNNAQLMEEFCELFLNGRNLQKYQDFIPKFILDDFCIDTDVIARICNEDILRKLIKGSYSSGYNKDYSDAYAALIESKLKSMSERYGLKYENRSLENVWKEPMHLIGNTEKYIIVNFQFNLTTSNQQTTYAEKVISPIKSACRGNDNIIVVNILDGAGWVARSSDYKKIYNSCDYFFTLNTLDNLENIIKDFFNI